MIAVESLTKRYRQTVAVDGLSFSVRTGSILAFLGPKGAGKTTTLRVLLGLAEPTSGTATIDGRPYRALRDPVGEVGAVLDSSGFHPGKFSLQGLGLRLSGGSGDDAGYDLFPLGVAALVYLGYAAGLLAATVAVATRRDVT